jgi:hypothetical protein
MQVEKDGVVDTGTSNAVLSRGADGRWELVETFDWATRPGRGVNRLAEVVDLR